MTDHPTPNVDISLFSKLSGAPGDVLWLLVTGAWPLAPAPTGRAVGISRQQAGRILARLERLGLAERMPGGFRLSHAARAALLANLARSAAESVEEEESISLIPDSHLLPPPNAEVESALRRAGVSAPKARQLACLPGLDAPAVQRLEQRLKREAGERYRPGLLVYRLQAGEREPEPQPERSRYVGGLICEHCFQYPCACDED